ncbi:MAG: ATPase, T2SS/T4P/T4SS family [Pseudomonadota bacterium]
MTKQLQATLAKEVRLPLGKRMVQAGLLTEPQLDLAIREQRRSGGYLGEVLVELGFVSIEDVTLSLADDNDVEMVEIRDLEVPAHVLDLLSAQTARQHKVMPIQLYDGVLKVAFSDVLDVVAQDVVERESGCTIDVVAAPEAHVLEAIERNYARSASLNETIEQVLAGDSLDVKEADATSPMVRLVDQILAAGIKHKATDIHLQPEERNLRVRLRVDGLLREEVVIPKAIQSAVLARIKLMAHLDITEKRVPQDGRIRFTFGSGYVDLRVSTLPTNYGESAVLRILDGGAVQMSLAALGFSERDLSCIEQAIQRPYGMILVTGPTGSGKTTTLYTALGTIDRQTHSVFTLEDPIEYTLPMVRQSQINADIGLSFAAGLRALLRQDPDVILVGEVRDQETAELATRAALTGHLVFSTLHTNNAVGVIPRLLDMGIDRYLLPSALVAIVGQRLLRKLCDACKRQVAGVDQLLLDAEMEPGTDAIHWQAVGCDECAQTGYSGRLGVYEVLMLDHSFHDAILEGGIESAMVKLAQASGMTSMLQDGLSKAQAGATTVAEVFRVLR